MCSYQKMNSALQILQQLEKEHERFAVNINAEFPYVLTYLRHNDTEHIPNSIEEFCKLQNINEKDIRLINMRSILETGILINSGCFYEAFRDVYLLDSIDHYKLDPESFKTPVAPSIPVIVEQFTGSISAISFDTNGASAIEGGGILAFDLRLPYIIRSITTGATSAIFQHHNMQDMIAPLGSLLFHVDDIQSELKERPNKAWQLNSAIAALLNDERPHLTLFKPAFIEVEDALFNIDGLIRHFLVAHEYAHICCGHNTFRVPLRLFNGECIASIPNDHKLEFEADWIAFTHLRFAAKRSGCPASIYVPYLIIFFIVLGVVESIRKYAPESLSINTEATADTHPHSMTRLDHILKRLCTESGKDNKFDNEIDSDVATKLFESSEIIHSIIYRNFMTCK